MKILTTVTVMIAIAALSTAWAQDLSPGPTRVCQIGVYGCPTHAEIQATWPARCPQCQTVLQQVQPSAATRVGPTAVADRDDRRREEARERERREEERRERSGQYGYAYPPYAYGSPPGGYYYNPNYYYNPDTGQYYYYGNPGYYPNNGYYYPNNGYYYPDNGYYYRPNEERREQEEREEREEHERK